MAVRILQSMEIAIGSLLKRGHTYLTIYFAWLLWWAWFFVWDAANNALVNRKPFVGWLALHVLFWLTRDIPAGITYLIIFRHYWKNDKVPEGKFEKLVWGLAGIIVGAVVFYLLFVITYDYVSANIDWFYGPDKPLR